MFTISKYWILLLAVLVIQNSYAIVKNKPQTYKLCHPSKNGPVEILPENFSSYNDLTKSEGDFDNPYYEKIVIRGVIKDKNCVPIPNVQIRLWQVDEYGHERYIKELATPEEVYDMNYRTYSEFKGTGAATTNNNGEFYVITTKPASESKDKKKRFINLSAMHSGFPKFQNKIILLENNQFSKNKDMIIAKNFYTTSNGITKIYDLELILDGKSKHLKY